MAKKLTRAERSAINKAAHAAKQAGRAAVVLGPTRARVVASRKAPSASKLEKRAAREAAKNADQVRWVRELVDDAHDLVRKGDYCGAADRYDDMFRDTIRDRSTPNTPAGDKLLADMKKVYAEFDRCDPSGWDT